MKNNPLDDIVKCDIEISSPAINDAAFNVVLVIVAAPTGTPKTGYDPTKTFDIASADELVDYGYSTTSAAYKAANVAFSQSPTVDKLLICVRRTVTEDETTTNEDLAVTLARANGESNFYGIYLADYRTATDIDAAKVWAEANEKLFGFEYTNIASFPVQNTEYYRTFAIFSGKADASSQPDENNYAALAWMAKCFTYQPGSETWALKTLSVIMPSALSTTEKSTLETGNISTYMRYAGSNVTIGGKTLAGEWIDVIRFRDWLKAEIQINVFNVLKVNRKVPFTDAGIGLIEGKIIETLSKAQDIGGIAPTEYDADENPIFGYEVNVPLASQLSEAERKSRRLTGVNWSARLAGAIHAVEIKGYLTF